MGSAHRKKENRNHVGGDRELSRADKTSSIIECGDKDEPPTYASSTSASDKHSSMLEKATPNKQSKERRIPRIKMLRRAKHDRMKSKSAVGFHDSDALPADSKFTPDGNITSSDKQTEDASKQKTESPRSKLSPTEKESFNRFLKCETETEDFLNSTVDQ